MVTYGKSIFSCKIYLPNDMAWRCPSMSIYGILEAALMFVNPSSTVTYGYKTCVT